MCYTFENITVFYPPPKNYITQHTHHFAFLIRQPQKCAQYYYLVWPLHCFCYFTYNLYIKGYNAFINVQKLKQRLILIVLSLSWHDMIINPVSRFTKLQLQSRENMLLSTSFSSLHHHDAFFTCSILFWWWSAGLPTTTITATTPFSTSLTIMQNMLFQNHIVVADADDDDDRSHGTARAHACFIPLPPVLLPSSSWILN